MDAGRREVAVLTPRVLTVPDTGSTNADLLQMAQAGSAGEGVWLRAERQHAGRGRLGRDWSSPLGNLYASTIVALRAGDPPPAGLALVAAVALEETVRAVLPERAGRLLRIKWPNDLLIADAKLSGILLERTGDHVVIGFGVNVVDHPRLPDRATTSLHAQGAAVEAAALVVQLAAMLAAWLAIWRMEGLAPIVARWVERAHPPGSPLRVRLPEGGALDGTFDGLDATGALRLRLERGDCRVIHAGDVFLI